MTLSDLELTPPPLVDLAEATHHCYKLLEAMGIEGDEHTPGRLVRALNELAGTRHVDPRHHLDVTFPPTSTDPGLVVVSDVPFVSLCEHHLLPFHGVATVGYLPALGGRIAGLSKLARVVQDYAGRPQVQERLADQVVQALAGAGALGPPRGAACAVRGIHSCMALRGPRTGQSAAMTTVQYWGELLTEPYRSEFNAHLTTPPWRG
jgi:GTP cyclohydrolase I